MADIIPTEKNGNGDGRMRPYDEELAIQALLAAGYGSYEGGRPQFREYLRMLRKHMWLIAGITVLATVLAGIYVARQPDVFEASARVRVDLENTGTSGGENGSGVVVLGNSGNDPAYFNTQLQILKGEALQRRVVKTLDLENNPDFLKGSQQSRSTVESLLVMVGLQEDEKKKDKVGTFVPTSSNATPTETPMVQTSQFDLAEAERLAPLVGGIRGGLFISPVRESEGNNRDTRLIEVSFTHSDPKVAAKVANTVADTFVLSNMERRVERNVSAGEFLAKRVAELQAAIRNGEERLINYARNNQILSLDANQNTVVDRLVGLNSQLLAAENERKLAEARYRAALAPGAAESLTDANATTEIQGKINELKRKRTELLQTYTEKFPEVRQIDEQLKTLEQQLRESTDRSTGRLKTRLETEYRQALARENSIRSSFNQQKGETMDQNTAAINYRIIQQEIETNKNLLNNLLQQARENDVVKAGSLNNISVAEFATTPRGAVGPKRLMVVSVVFALSLVFGIGLAIFVEYLNDSINTHEDVERYMGLATLAIIPDTGKNGRGLLGAYGYGYGSNKSESDTALVKATEKPELLRNQPNRSPLSEAYRQMRTSIMLSIPERAPKTLLVTSSLPSEGKTTISVNTALTLGQLGQRVVIIDADMRRPRVHKVFEIPNNEGLSNILSSQMSEDEIFNLVTEDPDTGLYVITAGQIPPNPAELIASEQMTRLIEILSEHFDHVVFDSPPIITCTDGVLLASKLDGTILVVHGGKTSREAGRRSKQLLKDVNARILGVVLNRITKKTSGYYYADYYKHYYQNYYSSDEESVGQ